MENYLSWASWVAGEPGYDIPLGEEGTSSEVKREKQRTYTSLVLLHFRSGRLPPSDSRVTSDDLTFTSGFSKVS